MFEQGVEAFEEGNYGMAYRRFRLLTNTLPLNRKTTAAVLMAGKALYRQGEYERAISVLSRFVRTYPSSSYVLEAEEALRFAEEQLDLEAERTSVAALGITLPLGPDDVALTQALFNGIRLAVEAFNETSEGVAIRMVFEDSGDEAAEARGAVAGLAGEAGVVIGPLYSGEAAAAAEAAEAAGVVMVAPLATDDAVSQGKRYVFQANPTLATRGRQMADFALRNLRLRSFGVVAERRGAAISEQMAEAFQEEVMRQGADVAFFRLLPSERAWSRLGDALAPDETSGLDPLDGVEALYLPVAGGDAAANVQAALRELERTGADVRVLGNAEWDDLPSKLLASTFMTTYTNDFYVDPQSPDVQAFARRYEELTGTSLGALEDTPRRLAFTGYDLARFLLPLVAGTQEGQLEEALRAAPPYQGLALRIDFGGGNVNQALYFLRYRAGRLELLR